MHFFFFSYTNPATTDIYTLSLHDALPILFLFNSPSQAPIAGDSHPFGSSQARKTCFPLMIASRLKESTSRSEEHTSELQSRQYLVCRLLLEKKKYNREHAEYELPGRY